LNVRILTLTPANFVPGEAAAVDADAAAVDAAGVDAAGADAAGDDWDGLAEALQAVRTRIGMIAAATMRYRDTTDALLLTSGADRPAY
jgi:hypothetical protein